MADGGTQWGNGNNNSCVLTKGLKPEELNSSVEPRSILNTDIPTPEVSVRRSGDAPVPAPWRTHFLRDVIPNSRTPHLTVVAAAVTAGFRNRPQLRGRAPPLCYRI